MYIKISFIYTLRGWDFIVFWVPPPPKKKNKKLIK